MSKGTQRPEQIAEWPHYESRRYDIERVMLGTSWLDDARVIRVSRKRQAERGPQRENRTLARWIVRQWSKLESEWSAIGTTTISYDDGHSDLFIRNLGAYRVDQRAVRRDADWDATVGDRRLDVSSDAIEIAVMRGEWPEPPAGCDCDCCEH